MENFAALMADRLATIEGKFCAGCGDSVAIATVPEWYQIRLEGKVPQLILVYQEVLEDGTLGNDYYPITVPHPALTNPPTSRLTGNYRKGDWQILLTLTDNSKVIINAYTEQEGVRLMSEIKQLIDRQYLANSTLKISHYPDNKFKKIFMTNFRADYYSTGMRNMKRDWSVKF